MTNKDRTLNPLDKDRIRFVVFQTDGISTQPTSFSTTLKPLSCLEIWTTFAHRQDWQVVSPHTMLSDNTKNKTGHDWMEHSWRHCIWCRFTEPHHPQQNHAEPNSGEPGRVCVNSMKRFKVPLSRHDWCQKWCCDIHNMVAHRKNNWPSPNHVRFGEPVDISKCRLCIWEPMWHCVPAKPPKDSLWKARWLGFADSSRDHVMHCVEEEEPKGSFSHKQGNWNWQWRM